MEQSKLSANLRSIIEVEVFRGEKNERRYLFSIMAGSSYEEAEQVAVEMADLIRDMAERHKAAEEKAKAEAEAKKSDA